MYLYKTNMSEKYFSKYFPDFKLMVWFELFCTLKPLTVDLSWEYNQGPVILSPFYRWLKQGTEVVQHHPGM